jgi:hypothetical protein
LRDERVEPRLLLQHICRGGFGSFLFEGRLHPLVAPVLLRMPEFDGLDLKAESQASH